MAEDAGENLTELYNGPLWIKLTTCEGKIGIKWVHFVYQALDTETVLLVIKIIRKIPDTV